MIKSEKKWARIRTKIPREQIRRIPGHTDQINTKLNRTTRPGKESLPEVYLIDTRALLNW